MTAVIMAAGMSSRYGTKKQFDSMGPNGESIIDYTIFDAIRAGFDKVVLVVNQDEQPIFESTLEKRVGDHIKIEYVVQDPNNLPSGCVFPKGRTKPLGTAHALYCCKGYIDDTFVILNADDFYGREAFAAVTMIKHLFNETTYGMVPYQVVDTLSEYGGVSRTVCEINRCKLVRLVERHHIEAYGKNACCHEEKNGEKSKPCWFPGATPVAMNFWIFTPTVFEFAEQALRDFFADNDRDKVTGECYLADVVEKAIETEGYNVYAIRSGAKWCGVTYQEDKPGLQAFIQCEIDSNRYPEKLWG